MLFLLVKYFIYLIMCPYISGKSTTQLKPSMSNNQFTRSTKDYLSPAVTKIPNLSSVTLISTSESSITTAVVSTNKNISTRVSTTKLSASFPPKIRRSSKFKKPFPKLWTKSTRFSKIPRSKPTIKKATSNASKIEGPHLRDISTNSDIKNTEPVSTDSESKRTAASKHKITSKNNFAKVKLDVGQKADRDSVMAKQGENRKLNQKENKGMLMSTKLGGNKVNSVEKDKPDDDKSDELKSNKDNVKSMEKKFMKSKSDFKGVDHIKQEKTSETVDLARLLPFLKINYGRFAGASLSKFL